MSRWRVVIAITGVLLPLAALAPSALAAGEVATRISIRPMDPVTIGTYVRVMVDLTLADGTPLEDEPVTLLKDGEPVHRTRTDLNGAAIFRLGKELAPGEYALTATYGGDTDKYFGTSARATLVVIPFELNIKTVPPLPGMAFELDGSRFVAGADGVARLSVDAGGTYELAVIEDSFDSTDQRVEFSRWNTELFGPRISIPIPYAAPLQAGFDIFFTASQTFVDLEGGRVDPSRVTSLTLRSSIGIQSTYPDGRARWYKASRVVRRPLGLESVEVRYNVEAVDVDGSNVVNVGQQRFLVRADDTWVIELLLYAAHITPRDALFGFPIGQAVDVTYPDGTVVRVEPDEHGELSARWLARGIYRMTVADAPGWAPVVPVALSRDQEVELRVISYLDFAVATLAALGLAVGLLHLGRPHLVPATVAVARGRVGRLVELGGTTSTRLAEAMRRSTYPAEERAGPATPGADISAARLISVVAPRSLPVTPPIPEMPSIPAMPQAPPSRPRRRHAAPTAGPAGPRARPEPERSRRNAAERPLAAPARAPRAATEASPPTTEVRPPSGVGRKPRAGSVPIAAATRGKRGAHKGNVAASREPPTGPKSAFTTARPAASAEQALKTSAEAASASMRAMPARSVSAIVAKTNGAAPGSAKAMVEGEAPASVHGKGSAKAKPKVKPRGSAKAKPKVKPRVSAKAKPKVKPRVSAKAKRKDTQAAPLRRTANGKAPASAKTKPRASKPSRASRTPAGRANIGRQRPRIPSAATSGAATTLIPVAIQADFDESVIAMRRLQLASLGLDDQGEHPLTGDVATAETVSCRGCGLAVWAEARFCRRCGQPVGESTRSDAPGIAAAGESPPPPQRVGGPRKRRDDDGAPARGSTKGSRRSGSARGSAR